MAERPVLCTFSKNNSTARSTKVKRFGMTEVNFLMRCPLSPRTDCFFFQAEDGIRDGRVTGVQTCALPIWLLAARPFHGVEVKLQNERLTKRSFLLSAGPLVDDSKACVGSIVTLTDITERKHAEEQQAMRSEERRVGKECRSRSSQCHQREK